MKYVFSILILIGMANAVSAQQQVKSKALPPYLYGMLRDSTTSADVVLMQGKGGSLSMDGKNVYFFNSFFDNVTAPKSDLPLGGNIMWQIKGKEFLSGSFYLNDSTGYVVIKDKGKEFVNKLSDQGFNFFSSQLKK